MKKIYKLSLSIAFALGALVSCTTETEYVTLVQPSVAIEDVESPNSTTITAYLVPNESSASYSYAIGFESDREAFLNGTLSSIVSSSVIEPAEVVFEGLEAQVSYTIYAISYDSEGNAGALSSYIMSSYDAVWLVEPVYCAATSLAVEISVNSAVYRVDYYLGEPGEADAFKNDEIGAAKNFTELTYQCLNFYDLSENTDYVFYTKFYDRRGNITEVNELPLTTYVLDEIPSVELIEEEESDIYKSSFTFIPNDLCGVYYILPGEAGAYSTIYDNSNGYAGNVYNMMLNWAGESWGVYTINGEHSFDMYNLALTSSMDYEFYALCCDKDGEPQTLQRFLLTTNDSENSGVAAVTIEAVEITSEKAVFKITPNEYTLGSLFSTYTQASYYGYWADGYLEDLKALQLSQWQAAVANGSEEPWNYGNEPFEYTELVVDGGLVQGTDYCVVVTPVNGAGVDAGGWGDIAVFDFTVPVAE